MPLKNISISTQPLLGRACTLKCETNACVSQSKDSMRCNPAYSNTTGAWQVVRIAVEAVVARADAQHLLADSRMQAEACDVMHLHLRRYRCCEAQNKPVVVVTDISLVH